MGIEGNVVIDAVIDRAGNVSSTKVVSGPVALRSAASDAVQRWKYMPTFLDGKSVPVETLATVEFHLH
jgi:TonB family protein